MCVYIYIYIYTSGLRANFRYRKSKYPLENATEIHWTILVTIHWTSDKPLGNATEVEFCLKMPLNIHRKMPLQIHNDLRSVDFLCAMGRLPTAATINPPRPGADELPSEAFGMETKNRSFAPKVVLQAGRRHERSRVLRACPVRGPEVQDTLLYCTILYTILYYNLMYSNIM